MYSCSMSITIPCDATEPEEIANTIDVLMFLTESRLRILNAPQLRFILIKFNSLNILEKDQRFNNVSLIIFKDFQDFLRSNRYAADFTYFRLLLSLEREANYRTREFFIWGGSGKTKRRKLICNILCVVFNEIVPNSSTTSGKSLMRTESYEISSCEYRWSVSPSVDLR
jgi:hypothetical protein